MKIRAYAVERAANDLLRMSGERIVSFKKMPGAFNCIVYSALTDKGRKYIIKRYNQKKNDKRDRLLTEFGGLSFLWKNGLRQVPKPIAFNRKEAIGIYSFIEGRKVRGKDIKLNDVMKAAKMIGQMNKLNSARGASSQPNASEACFSIKSYIKLVEKRMKRLESSEPTASLKRFIRDDLKPYLLKVRKFVVMSSLKRDIDTKRVLSRKERFLSPSDVGFHNILKDRSGNIYFIDFEYFGWDDPAKTISDFFLQPGSPMPAKFREKFFKRVSGYFGSDIRLTKRLPLVCAILSVKWCQIMLNVFLGNDIKRDTIICEKQLKKAKNKLREVSRELERLEFPYSLVREVNK